MGDLSDLDLVAQAMAPTNKPDRPTESTTSEQQAAQDHSSLPLENIDLSSLTSEDLAMLQPILDALNLGDSDDLDDAALHDILKQMDVAGDVADDLEGKLDKLIGELGKVEEGILGDMDGKDDKGQVERGDKGNTAEEKEE
jgi:hypothetical protein